MKDYKFTHNDGREGIGWSCWAAIVAALGPAEAQTLPEMRDPAWEFIRTGGIWKQSAVELESGEIIGKLQELYEC
jgi:hypothetical protein